MIRKFKVISCTNPLYQDREFECNTEIKHNVSVPFSINEYRCIMFNGIEIQLVNGKDEIRGRIL